MTLPWKVWRGVLTLLLLATALATTESALGSGPAPASTDQGQQVGRILSVRKVLGSHYFVSRYPRIHYYMLYLAVCISDQTYCGAYETPILDEIDDAFAAQGKDAEVTLKEKRLTVITPKGCKLKAHLVEPKEC